ncbi:uncharacterized protein LOC121429415 [Lytechinus variegatus]|uniref:uncharacterized protein LOC121429415 n=1 Tax=Lytechinus variegatus TaxID=7654 RepID=UPI001BB25FC4|nr:uncharacterized protein LOC121429415 [Lytechinus variegatus]
MLKKLRGKRTSSVNPPGASINDFNESYDHDKVFDDDDDAQSSSHIDTRTLIDRGQHDHRRSRHQQSGTGDVCEVDLITDDSVGKRVKDIQEEINEVVEIFVKNINIILEREGKIEELERISDDLRTKAEEFQHVTRKLLLKK